MCVNILIQISVKNGKPGGTDSDRLSPERLTPGAGEILGVSGGLPSGVIKHGWKIPKKR